MFVVNFSGQQPTQLNITIANIFRTSVPKSGKNALIVVKFVQCYFK